MDLNKLVNLVSEANATPHTETKMSALDRANLRMLRDEFRRLDGPAIEYADRGKWCYVNSKEDIFK